MMMNRNDFVNYLNSTNNIGGNTTGSLAESQVKSSYYDVIKVDRALGDYITSGVKTSNHKAFILTGHAGDGKTSILVQVLKDLQKLQPGEGLSVENEYSDFLYVKDMSEIPTEKQALALKKAIEAPSMGKTSLLISNTGPLLKTFEMLVRQKREAQGLAFDAEDRMQVQSKLLKQLDLNDEETLDLEGFEFILINIARVDNVTFATEIMKNIMNQTLWTPCANCSCAARCPIYNNTVLVREQFDRVVLFVENYYRYLYENDKRMTIRQMVGQISYALTGNLTCDYIEGHNLKEPFFRYNFSNLFFGYKGLTLEKEAGRIKGIAQIRNLELDRMALSADDKLFVKQDYSDFLPRVRKELDSLLVKSKKYYQTLNKDDFLPEKKHARELSVRRAVRRFYLVFALPDFQVGGNQLMNEVFGESYMDYKDLISVKQPKHMLKKIQQIVFDALYVKNTGFFPDGQTEIPLTLRRDDDVFQNVMIVLGNIKKNDLVIEQKKVDKSFEDLEAKYNLILNLNVEEFNLSLPIVT